VSEREADGEPEEDELAAIDPIDPLKRDPEREDERMPGWDPVVPPIPPED
jgi:hypothetical protein